VFVEASAATKTERRNFESPRRHRFVVAAKGRVDARMGA
jgi:hypothetical protein